MSHFVGVKHPFQLLNHPSVKRDALIFAKIALPHYKGESLAHMLRSKLSSDLLNELDWLIERGIVFTPETIPNESSLYTDEKYKEIILTEAGKYLNTGMQIGMRKNKSIEDALDDAELAFFFKAAFQETIRRTSIELRLNNGLEAYPILFDDLFPVEASPSNKSTIIQIVLNALPIVDESTSWEQIIEYRSDPDSQDKFLDLRNWMSEIARSQLTAKEVEEKLEYLLRAPNKT